MEDQSPKSTFASSRPLLFKALLLLVPTLIVLALALIIPCYMHASHKPTFAKGLTIVVRTPGNLDSPAAIPVLVARFKANNVSRVWVQCKQDETQEFVGGEVFYPSTKAPVARSFEDDRLGKFINALADAGIEVYGWMPCLNDPSAIKAHPQWAAQMVNPEGQLETSPNWLCPRQEQVAQYEGAIAAEIATRYPRLKGLYIDFIRFDSDYSCACPGCLKELEKRSGGDEDGDSIQPVDLIDAANRRTEMWKEWTAMRSEFICNTARTICSAVKAARADLPVGACVLPFSANGYNVNTQSGQDLEEMAQTGLAELVLMCYWDDWDKSPAWAHDSVMAARKYVDPACKVSMLLDGDMSVRRTRYTMQALDDYDGATGFFEYGQWTDNLFTQLRRGLEGHDRDGVLPKPDKLDVVIRIDTEPDAEDRYDTVNPQMVRQIMDLLESEGVRGTFITCGKLAELQPEVIREAEKRGHEIGCHAYEHLQDDEQPDDVQIGQVDHGIDALRKVGVKVYGFGHPRNSISEISGDREIECNLEYDCSESYDPTESFLDASYLYHNGPAENSRIVCIPFIQPNDWDARDLSPTRMAGEWKQRLDMVAASGEPCFVLDVHQWLASKPRNLQALKMFIRYAKANPRCRFVTLRQAAQDVRALLDQYELPCPTSGSDKPPYPTRPAPATMPASGPTATRTSATAPMPAPVRSPGSPRPRTGK